MTLFEMMAHHAFNSAGNEIYWKNETVALCDEFLASIGADLQRITYKEHPWVGGGNAGPSLEVLIGGLEVATLVFMNLGRQKTGQPPSCSMENRTTL
jgi:alanyl-tRNA synthetase